MKAIQGEQSPLKNSTATIIIAAILSLISLIAFHQFWLPKGITISFDYSVHHPIEFEVLYASRVDEPWASHRAERQRIQQRKGSVSIFLPTPHIEKLRIDPGSKSTHVVLSNIQLQGTTIKKIGQDADDFKKLNIDILNIRNGEVRLATNHKDPILEYTKPLNIETNGARKFKLLNFLIALLTPFYLTFVLRDMWKESHNEKGLKKSPKLANIEFLRIIFTLAVVYFHFCGKYVHGFSAAGQAVEFFFILSGFLLAYTFRANRSLIDIAKRNWIRFVPLTVVGGLLAQGGWESFYGLFMIQCTGLAFDLVPNGPAWYLGVLFWVSLFYAALYRAFDKDIRNLIIGIITFVSFLLIVRTGGDWYGRYIMVADYIPKSLLRGLGGMGLGILLAQACKRSTSPICFSLNNNTILYTILETACLLYVIASFFTNKFFSQYWIFIPISNGILLALFVLKRGIVSTILDLKIFSIPAKYCLSIYLMHWVLWVNRFWEIPNEGIYNLFIVLALSVILGISAYYLIEKPFVKLLTPLFFKKQN